MLTFTTQRGIGEGMNICKHCFRLIHKLQSWERYEYYHYHNQNRYCDGTGVNNVSAEPLFKIGENDE